MPCTSPLDAWPPPPEAEDRRPVFSPRRSYAGALAFKLPCGRCLSCRLERAGDLATRAVHEAQMHAAEGRGSCFVTYTFADEFLPKDLSVSVSFVQRFHHRMRKAIGPFRFLLSAEYGDRDKRPHYHGCYFGHDFREDRYPWKKTEAGVLYRSPTLERVWTYGHCLLSDFTRENGGYTARYTTKKAGGGAEDAAYTRFDDDTGEVWQVQPEFLLASRNPGLGAAWFDKYKAEVFPSDFLILDGRRVPVPRYYLNRLAEDERAAVQAQRKADSLAKLMRHVDPSEDLAALTREERAERVAGRQRLGAMYSGDNNESRLLVKHELQALRGKRLLRMFDAET